MAIYVLDGVAPQVAASAWIADSAQVMGSVELAEDTSVWFGTVIRGDTDNIRIGRGSNIQDGSVLHADHGKPLPPLLASREDRPSAATRVPRPAGSSFTSPRHSTGPLGGERVWCAVVQSVLSAAAVFGAPHSNQVTRSGRRCVRRSGIKGEPAGRRSVSGMSNEQEVKVQT
jgi:hypothetical protein